MSAEDRAQRTVAITDIPKHVKGFTWFDGLAGRDVKIEGTRLLGNSKGATRYAALVYCGSRDQAKDLVRRVKAKDEGPRAKVLNDDKEVEDFRAEMAKSKGWSKDAPDGDQAITPNFGADIRGDASGFSHGFNPSRLAESGHRDTQRSGDRRSPSPHQRLARSRSRGGVGRRGDDRGRGSETRRGGESRGGDDQSRGGNGSRGGDDRSRGGGGSRGGDNRSQGGGGESRGGDDRSRGGNYRRRSRSRGGGESRGGDERGRQGEPRGGGDDRRGDDRGRGGGKGDRRSESRGHGKR